MFALEPGELAWAAILDCPGGASPFGAQVRARGGTVTSVDPLYNQPAQSIVNLVADNLATARAWLTANTGGIDWDHLGSPDAHIRASEIGADLFAADYTAHPEHYRPATLPHLPFREQHFDLALSANFLFVYDHALSVDDHIAALLELVRVTRGEVRVHPVHALHDGVVTRYRHLDHVRDVLADHGVTSGLRPTTTSWIIDARQTLICSRAPDPISGS